MDAEPLIVLTGKNGILKLHERTLRIERGTIFGFIGHGLAGKKDILIKHVTSVQIKKPGLTVGYIQFSIPGGVESQGGVLGALRDENTVTFNGQENFEKALQIKDFIEKENTKADTPVRSELDDLEKLHSLMEKGIITKKEFDQKKKRILQSE